MATIHRKRMLINSFEHCEQRMLPQRTSPSRTTVASHKEHAPVHKRDRVLVAGRRASGAAHRRRSPAARFCCLCAVPALDSAVGLYLLLLGARCLRSRVWAAGVSRLHVPGAAAAQPPVRLHSCTVS